MRCLHCGKPIGVMRRWLDRQFCSDAHRKRAKQIYSAREARQWSDNGLEDEWVVRLGQERKPQSSFTTGAGVLLVVLATLLVMFLPGRPKTPVATGPSYLPPVDGIAGRVTRMFPSRPSFSMRETFGADLRNWQGSLNSNWSKVGNAVLVGDLRLWKPTLSLSDYNLTFATEIEQRGVSWTYRSTDSRNYYATRLRIAKTGGGQRAEIIRYAMLNGHQQRRTVLPIPLMPVKGDRYEVWMRVKGSNFTTMINGEAVDTWSDRRLKKGGVGFFSDAGERAKLLWVSVSERENFLERFLSFGFFVHPLQEGSN